MWRASEARAVLDLLDSAERELVLDFSGVERLDPAAIRELEDLAAKARERSVQLVLRGVPVQVYKVLKLVAAAGQFSFRN
jgi:anti-anti-sigma regulatory factor